ncbi:NAD(P)/FAD-dependent oxidoreductase [Halorubrum vacuolatum]|uniref:Amine oxidase domain-containing protein n=1 Tax=Halorubrum vacuolatum TaxID=63740 RepID=A0A238XBA0_HALVU|nr:FAD-dependent oxidoreductase [Halorubrum vacuolatum]SNR55614.1 hypothetical protein SAMN06264855_11521 [Halorubrum vacuolatum]
MGVRLCVVGAGVAGAGIAYALRAADVDVTVLEKSRGVGGRAATRRRNGRRYDHGANYLKSTDPRTADLLDAIGPEGLVDVTDPVWLFGADGDVRPGDDRDEHKWSFETGITRLAKRLFARTDATVRKTTRVESATRTTDGWTLQDTDGAEHGPFDAVCYTPPAPQTAELLAETTIATDIAEDVDGEDLEAFRDAVASVPYRTIRTLVLGYDERIERPYYALLNDDREHPVGWLAREECKDGHVPDDESLLIVQMSPAWSSEHYDDPLADAAAVAADHAADLLDSERVRDPDWVDDQGWRYALPDDGIDPTAARTAEPLGLFVAGDWVAGDGRVHAALWDGIETGERIATWGGGR